MTRSARYTVTVLCLQISFRYTDLECVHSELTVKYFGSKNAQTACEQHRQGPIWKAVAGSSLQSPIMLGNIIMKVSNPVVSCCVLPLKNLPPMATAYVSNSEIRPWEVCCAFIDAIIDSYNMARRISDKHCPHFLEYFHTHLTVRVIGVP